MRFKARLCAKGFEKQQLFGYESTYALVETLAAVRFMLSLAVKHNMEVHSKDVKMEFHSGNFNEEVYIQ